MGLYKRKATRFWWMSYTMNGEQYCESTKATSKELASKVWKKRESEIVLGLFKSKLDRITVEMIEEYRDQRRRQPTKLNPNRTVKGATVNRELECLKCVLDLAVKRKYVPENPASMVKHFNELRDRPIRRMLTVKEEN